MNFVEHNKEEFSKAVEHLRHDIAGLRTGRANSALVEDVMVECYGGSQPVKAVASIVISDPRTITIEPWDKSLMQPVELALRNGQLGINPVNDGKLIRVPLPQLTQERRQELIKVLHNKLEAARIAVRQVREMIKREIDNAETGGSVTEDEKFKQYEALEKIVKESNDELKTIGEEKEKEINTI